MHKSTKTYPYSTGLSCAFRQWRAESHCNKLHGYSLQVKFEFGAVTLDHRNWVVDFGSMKQIKKWLEENFDHKTLISEDDPLLNYFEEGYQLEALTLRIVPKVGCEAFAQMIFEYVDEWCNTTHKHAQLLSVEVKEHDGNGAIFSRDSASFNERITDHIRKVIGEEFARRDREQS